MAVYLYLLFQHRSANERRSTGFYVVHSKAGNLRGGVDTDFLILPDHRPEGDLPGRVTGIVGNATGCVILRIGLNSPAGPSSTQGEQKST